MVLIVGNDSDNSLVGTFRADILLGKGGNDILEGLGGKDTLLGGKNDDYLFGGGGFDLLSGDGDSITVNSDGSIQIDSNAEKGDDILVGGAGGDILVGWGDDILVGSGSARYNAQLINDLKNDPFNTPIVLDGQSDTFIALNKDAIDYTLTIADYEVGIDQIDLRAFNVLGATDFAEIQDKGNFFELKTPEVNGAELVLRINSDPTLLSYVS